MRGVNTQGATLDHADFSGADFSPAEPSAAPAQPPSGADSQPTSAQEMPTYSEHLPRELPQPNLINRQRTWIRIGRFNALKEMTLG